jgi:hypothetical protein
MSNDHRTRDRPLDAIDMLYTDHQRVRNAFRRYEAAATAPMRARCAAQAFTLLELHTQLEAHVFYPAFERFQALFRTLIRRVEAHMVAEEAALFPQAAVVLADQMAHLRSEMATLKRNLLS